MKNLFNGMQRLIDQIAIILIIYILQKCDIFPKVKNILK